MTRKTSTRTTPDSASGKAGRVAARPGVAGSLVNLAALVSPGLPGVPGPLQLRGRGSGQPPSGAEGPELQVRLGQPPAAFRPRVGQHRGGVQVLGPPGPGEVVHGGGDAVDDRRPPGPAAPRPRGGGGAPRRLPPLPPGRLDPLADRHPLYRASRVQETGCLSGADGSVVTGFSHAGRQWFTQLTTTNPHRRLMADTTVNQALQLEDACTDCITAAGSRRRPALAIRR